MKSRFLNLNYVLNTVRIKVRSLGLRLSRRAYPYAYFKDKTSLEEPRDYNLNFIDKYHSLSYLNLRKANTLHSGTKSITQELIIGMVQYDEYRNDAMADYADILLLADTLKQKAVCTDESMTFYFDEVYEKFDLNAQYASGIVQGKASSFFLRCYLLTKEVRYKQWAKKCLNGAWRSIEEGGVLIELQNGCPWIEEYPSPKPSMVLNGFLFYIIGLAEYLAFENDPEIQHRLDTCLKSVLTWMPHFRLNDGLLYSMYRWSLCNVHYTGIMSYQFEHIFQLTGIATFKEYAEFTNGLTDWKVFNSLLQA